MARTVLVTGGAGFIGSELIRYLISQTDACVVNVDKLTYAANLDNLLPVVRSPRYRFFRADICAAGDMAQILNETQPDRIIHLAAESHVDRSIEGPMAFVQTNLVGTATLLSAALQYWNGLPPAAKAQFRFHHVSTDEVYGSLGHTAYSPSRRPTTRARPIRPPRPAPTIWSGRGATPSGCRSSSPTARTITGPISFRKSSSR